MLNPKALEVLEEQKIRCCSSPLGKPAVLS
jgi:hypothetical protein